MNPENEDEWVEAEAEVIHDGPLPNFGGPPQPMSPTTKVQLFKMVLSMPGGMQRIAESIQNSPNPEQALRSCYTIIDLVEEDAKQEVRRAQAALDKCDGRLMRIELERAMNAGK